MSTFHRSLFAVAVFLCASSAQANPTELTRIGLGELAQDQPVAAIAEIEANPDLDADDPARNINLAVAYARAGRPDEARRHFDAVRLSEQRVELQTAAGEWIDSRELARLGLRKLARGEFHGASAPSLASR